MSQSKYLIRTSFHIQGGCFPPKYFQNLLYILYKLINELNLVFTQNETISMKLPLKCLDFTYTQLMMPLVILPAYEVYRGYIV